LSKGPQHGVEMFAPAEGLLNATI